MSHPNAKISQSGNLCIISGVGERGCKQYAAQDGGTYWQVIPEGMESAITGKIVGADTCTYILSSVYARMSAVCGSLGGTPDGEGCKNINVSLIPNGQTCKEYVSGIYTEWPIGGMSTETTTNGRITKCSFDFLSHLDWATGRTYVGNDIEGTCFDNMVAVQPTGNCICKENYGYTSAYSCAPCGSEHIINNFRNINLCQ